MFDHPRWTACGGYVCWYIANHSQRRADDREFANGHAGNHLGAGAQKCSLLDTNIRGQMRTGCDVCVITDHAVMIDTGGCIDNCMRSNGHARLDDSARKNHGARTQDGRIVDIGPRMNGRDPVAMMALSHLPAKQGIADGNHRGKKIVLTKFFRRTDDGNANNRFIPFLGIVVVHRADGPATGAMRR